MSPVCGVVGMVAFTGLFVRTAGTYIRRLVQEGTMHGYIRWAYGSAIEFRAAFTAMRTAVIRFLIAQISSQTRLVVNTIV